MEEIKQISVKEMLILCYNEHINTYTRQLIELSYLQGRPLDEVVATLIQRGQQEGMPGVGGIERKIKCKDAQLAAKHHVDKEGSILKVIDSLIKSEDKKPTKFE